MGLELELPPATSAFAIAEYIEVRMLSEAVSELSAAEVRSFFPAGSQPAQAEIELALAEIDARSKRLRPVYPYVRRDGLIVRTETSTSFIYDFLCVLSLDAAPYRQQREWRRSDPFFDELVAAAAAHYFGEGTRSLVFGWPPRGLSRPSDFIQAVSWVGEQLELDNVGMDRPADDKDAGVDVIAWKPFKDGRSGFPVYLVQCTVQLDYARKGRDVEPNIWLQWLGFGTPPIPCIAIPFAVEKNDDRWLHLNNRSTVILERLRICEALSKLVPAEVPHAFEIKQFIQAELQGPTSPAGKPSRVAKPRRQTDSPYRSPRAR